MTRITELFDLFQRKYSIVPSISFNSFIVTTSSSNYLSRKSYWNLQVFLKLLWSDCSLGQIWRSISFVSIPHITVFPLWQFQVCCWLSTKSLILGFLNYRKRYIQSLQLLVKCFSIWRDIGSSVCLFGLQEKANFRFFIASRYVCWFQIWIGAMFIKSFFILRVDPEFKIDTIQMLGATIHLYQVMM